MCPQPSPWEPWQAELQLRMSSLPQARTQRGRRGHRAGSGHMQALPQGPKRVCSCRGRLGGQVAVETELLALPGAQCSDREVRLHRAPLPLGPSLPSQLASGPPDGHRNGRQAQRGRKNRGTKELATILSLLPHLPWVLGVPVVSRALEEEIWSSHPCPHMS